MATADSGDYPTELRAKTVPKKGTAVYSSIMASYALSAIGRDRPGIVAEVTGVLLRHKVNIADSQMAILGGHFAMMMVLEAPEGADIVKLRADLEDVRTKLELEAISLAEIEEARTEIGKPSHMITLYGADHPGIVHAVTKVLAEHGVNITDLDTHLVNDGEEPYYMMILEVALPKELSGENLEKAMREIAREQKLELAVRPLDQVAL